MKLDAAAILAVCPLLGLRANDWVEPLNQVIRSAELNTAPRLSYFMANASAESLQLTTLTENLNYKAEVLLSQWGHYFTPFEAADYAHKPERIANRAYADRLGNGDEASGDGWRYRGRGIFQITGKDNYRIASIALFGDSVLLVEDPDLVAEVKVAAMTAAWYWRDNYINRFADLGDFDGCCDMINRGRKTEKIGDAHGFDKRVAALKVAQEVFA